MKHINHIATSLVALAMLVGCDVALDTPVEEEQATSTVRPETAETLGETTGTQQQPVSQPQQPAPAPADNSPASPAPPAATPEEPAQGNQDSAPETPGANSKASDGADQAPAPAAPPEPPPAKAPIYDGGSPPTQWTNNGTSKMPKYGEDCRLTTDHVFEAATNGATDDSMSLVVYSPKESTLDIEVVSSTGLALSANVDLTRGLPGRSYRDAEGWATFEYAPGLTAELPVIDGTLCFAEKLSEATGDVLAEFSFIVVVDGTYQSMGGNVIVPWSALSNIGNGVLDAGQAVDIDLR